MKSNGHIRFSILLVLVFTCVNSVYAGSPELPEGRLLINSFFNSIYDFSFHKADSIAGVMKTSKADNITLSIVKANLYWWKILSGDDIESNLSACSYSIDESLKFCLEDHTRDINRDLNIICLYSLKARLDNYRGNSLKAFLSFYKSIPYIQGISQSQIKDERMDFALGMYYYFVDYIGTKYFIFNAVLLPFHKGDREKGLMYLEKCTLSDDEMIRTEAHYFLMKIYEYTEKDYPRAYLNSVILVRWYPGNFIYRIEQLRLLNKMMKKEEAGMYKKILINDIQTSRNINNNQKNHLISQIDDIVNFRDK